MHLDEDGGSEAFEGVEVGEDLDSIAVRRMPWADAPFIRDVRTGGGCMSARAWCSATPP